MVLELDPNMSPGAQMNKAFAKARRLERGLVMGQERATKMKTQMDAYQSALDSLRSNTLSLSEIEVFLTRLGLAARQTKRPQAGEHTSQKAPLLGRRFTSSDGALMIVGRTAHENDEITRRAKSGDWWFHTSGSVHGAHVVVPVRSLPGKALTPNTQKEACILALHFSGLSLSREGEVYVTQRAQLRKRKGMPEGLWHIERTQTVVVRYESTELTQIFAREDRQGVMRVHEDGNQND